MPDVLIQCPQCQRQLRVPDEMVGRLVRCPTCAATFTVAPGGGEVRPATPAVPPSPAPPPAGPPPVYTPTPSGPGEAWDEPARDRAYHTVRLPAYCLLVTALLSLVLSGWFLFRGLTADPEALRAEAMARSRQDFPREMGDPDVFFGRVLTGIGVVAGACVVMSAVIVVGSVQMLRLRTHLLAVVSSVLAMLLICPGCCVVGTPFGIWSLTVLFRPDIKAAFH